MNIYTTRFSCNLNINITDTISFNILNYDSGSIIVEIKINDTKIIYHSVHLETWFEKFVYFEILNELPLWSYIIYRDQTSITSTFLTQTFFLCKCFSQLFSSFRQKKISAKAARKMLMKLTTE